MAEKRTISRVRPDALALRALAHPVRLRMLGLLRIDGPATASGLAAQLGLNSGATSYHLRQLARHGFIEDDAGRGNGRERWWRARHETTSFAADGADDETLRAGVAFGQAALHWQIGEMERALAQHAALSPAWRRASTLNDFNIPLTAAQASALVERLLAVLWEAMAAAPALGGPYPDGVQPVTFILHAFPRPPEGGARS